MKVPPPLPADAFGEIEAFGVELRLAGCQRQCVAAGVEHGLDLSQRFVDALTPLLALFGRQPAEARLASANAERLPNSSPRNA